MKNNLTNGEQTEEGGLLIQSEIYEFLKYHKIEEPVFDVREIRDLADRIIKIASHPIKGNDMTVQDFYSGFNLDFLTEDEKKTIYDCTELYARGKLRQQSLIKGNEGEWPTDKEIAIELVARYNGNSRGNPIAKKAFIDAVEWLKTRERPKKNEEEYYPGKDYQRLFGHLMNSFQIVALQSEMQEIIKIVHEDFPGEWISVETELPLNKNEVAVIVEDEFGDIEKSVARYIKEDNRWYRPFKDIPVSHSMPLPSPPKI